MADIFVSYRRDDSQWSAGRINDRLAADFGAARVFFDTVTIEPAEDFVEVLGAKVGAHPTHCLRCAARGPNTRDYRGEALGFRVARTLD